MLKKLIRKCGGLDTAVEFDLFDKMILPILLYGAEIWGFERASEIEKVHAKFCKYVLGVPTQTSTLAVLSETGRVPLYVYYFKRCITYWLKVVSLPSHRFPYACYSMLYVLDQNGRKTWATYVKQLLYKYNFHEVWDQQGVANTATFLSEFESRVKQLYIEEWDYDIRQSSKLSLLRSIASSCVEVESYLCNDKLLWKYRSCLSKLRCSAHTLAIEKGRHKNVLVAERICTLCEQSGEIVLEDEYHFVLHCPTLAHLREQYQIVDMESYADFLKLLTSEDVQVQLRLAAFVYHASRLRCDLLSNRVL